MAKKELPIELERLVEKKFEGYALFNELQKLRDPNGDDAKGRPVVVWSTMYMMYNPAINGSQSSRTATVFYADGTCAEVTVESDITSLKSKAEVVEFDNFKYRYSPDTLVSVYMSGAVYDIAISGLYSYTRNGTKKPCVTNVSHRKHLYTEQHVCQLNRKEAERALFRLSPSAYKQYIEYGVDNGFLAADYLVSPPLAELQRKGYAFAMNKTYLSKAAYNQLVKPVVNPKSIQEYIKIPVAYLDVMKDCADVGLIDSVRKLIKTFGGNPEDFVDDIQQLYDMCQNKKMMAHARAILSRTFNGKPLYTVKSLIAYIKRMDVEQALDPYVGYELLDTYTAMCEQMQMPPKTDSDSLKREMDICVRMKMYSGSKSMEKKFHDSRPAQPFEYVGEKFIVREIVDFKEFMEISKTMSGQVRGFFYDRDRYFKIYDSDAMVDVYAYLEVHVLSSGEIGYTQLRRNRAEVASKALDDLVKEFTSAFAGA